MQTRIISFRGDILPLKNVLYRLALRITLSHEDAEDVVQDTMMKLWNKRDEWPTIDNIAAYPPQGNGPGAKLPLAAGLSPYEQTAQRDRVDMVRRMVDSLPEKQRSCIQLRDFEGMSYKEIATILNISEEQVKVNIFRARQTIKKKFSEVEEYGL